MRHYVVIAALLTAAVPALGAVAFTPTAKDVMPEYDYTQVRYGVVASPRLALPKTQDASTAIRNLFDRILFGIMGARYKTGLRCTPSDGGKNPLPEADAKKYGLVLLCVVERFAYNRGAARGEGQWAMKNRVLMRTKKGWKVLNEVAGQNQGFLMEHYEAIKLGVYRSYGGDVSEDVLLDAIAPLSAPQFKKSGEPRSLKNVTLRNNLPYWVKLDSVDTYATGGGYSKRVGETRIRPPLVLEPFGQAIFDVTVPVVFQGVTLKICVGELEIDKTGAKLAPAK